MPGSANLSLVDEQNVGELAAILSVDMWTPLKKYICYNKIKKDFVIRMPSKNKFRPVVWGLSICIAIIIIVTVLIGKRFVLVKYNYLIGSSKQKNKDYDGAIIAFSKVLEYDSTFTVAYISRGSSYLDIKKYDDAIVNYNKAIQIESTNAQAYAFRGRAYYELKDSINALKDYDRAISLDNNLAYAYYHRGLLKYTLLKSYDEGCADLHKALQLGMTEAQNLIDNGECK
ncbi:MAG: tetratricopeptide repeat protein [Bacteroidetes bacterium]|nr:tetratricopeptide repeat protein [Bacteroidota bacterium]